MRAQAAVAKRKQVAKGAGWDDRCDWLEEPFRLRLLEVNLDVSMVRLASRLGTSGNSLEPLVAIVLLLDAPAPVCVARRLVPMLVHLPAALKPAALAHEPIRLARADEYVGERAPTCGLDVHHSFDTRARLSRQEAENRFVGRCNHRR